MVTYFCFATVSIHPVQKQKARTLSGDFLAFLTPYRCSVHESNSILNVFVSHTAKSTHVTNIATKFKTPKNIFYLWVINQKIMNKVIIFIAILTAFAFSMWLASCSPERRFDRLTRNHPELFKKDTIHDTTVIKVFVYVDSGELNKANTDFENNMDSASKNTSELQKKEPCAELANKTQKNLSEARNAKHRIDTIYKQAECRIKPYFKSDSNVIISAKVVDGNIIVDYTFKKFKYECKQKEYWEYWQFWLVSFIGFCLFIMWLRK